MHMADALLSPAVAVTMYAASAAAAGVSLVQLHKEETAAPELARKKTPDDGCHVCARLRRTDDQLHHPRNRLAADGPARELLRDKALLEENGLELPLCLAGVPEF